VLPPTLDAQLRAAVALSGVAGLGPLEAAVRLATVEPTVVDEPVAGVPSLLVRPGRGTQRPALVVLNGVTARGRRHPAVERLAIALGRAGFVTCVPDPPGLARGPIGTATLQATIGLVDAAAAQAPCHRVGLVGVSLGGTLALLAAEEPDLADRITVVACIAPHLDFAGALRLAANGNAPGFLSLVSARSLLAGLPASPERDALLERLDAVGDDDRDPLAVLAGAHADDGVRAVCELLLNTDPARFDELYTRLPAELQADVARLSPLAAAEKLRAPVELALPTHDKYVPAAHNVAFARAAVNTRVRLTFTAALDHAVPKLSLRELDGLLRFDGWTVRALRHASEP
jgi:pimeloyl-ACP methyl ester carboxylesterase